MSGKGFEFVGRRFEFQAGDIGYLFGKFDVKALWRVKAGAKGSPALCQFAKPDQRIINPIKAKRDLGGIAREFLPQSQRHRILHVGAADFDDIGKGFDLGIQRTSQMGQGRFQVFFDLDHSRDMHGGGEAVIGRLPAIDMIVGMNRIAFAHRPAKDFARAVGDDLVGIHVGLRATAGLPDDKREVIKKLAIGDFARGGLDCLGKVGIQIAKGSIGACGGKFLYPERPDQGIGHPFAANAEILFGSLGLRPPIPVRGHIDAAHGVLFGAGGHWIGHDRNPPCQKTY